MIVKPAFYFQHVIAEICFINQETCCVSGEYLHLFKLCVFMELLSLAGTCYEGDVCTPISYHI